MPDTGNRKGADIFPPRSTTQRPPVDFWDRATQSVLCRRATYNHAKYLEQRADMVQKWADYLDELKAHSGIAG